VTLVVSACGRGSSAATPSATTPPTAVNEPAPTAAVDINPADFNPADFTTNITHPYFSLPVGKKTVYASETEAGTKRLEILIPGWTYTIMGVETLAYWNRVYVNDVLLEDTRDYLAQNKQTGDVWYFGEHVDNYENGKLANHDGTWFAGEGAAKPGIWMIANPQVGDEFVHESKSGTDYNMAKIIGVNESITVPAGGYTDCVKTLATAFPAGTTANFYFCKDIADIVLEVDLKGPETPADTRIELVEVDDGGARNMTEVPAAYAQEGVVGPSAKPTGDRVTCEAPSGVTIPMPTTYLYIEHNSTAEDTGIHGMFDSSTMAELCVYDPSGRQILAIKPQNQLGQLTMAGIFFESREPAHSDVPVEEHLRNFPEGQYAVRGVTYDGIGYHGAATFTHNIPKPPKMIFPLEMADEADIKSQIIVPSEVAVAWEPVTETIFGKPVTIKAYEVIVRSLLPSDPHGFSHDNLDIHLPASATSLAIPNEFWKPSTPYEFEVLAVEESGNQTLVSGFFETGEAIAGVPDHLPTIEIVPANFVAVVDNPYLPRIPGSKFVYEGQTQNGFERIELEVLHETKVIMGITTTIVRDTVYLDGAVIEDTYDWIAQDKEGNVWYFGEDVSDYENGKLVSKAGSWEAGVDGALPGILMYADPAAHVGETYLQEYYAGEAEDTARILNADASLETSLGSFENVVRTYDFTPLDPESQEHKFYAEGVGSIKIVNLTTGDEIVLVEHHPAGGS
jgi:hypothetical protein